MPDVLSEIVRTADALCAMLEASALSGLRHPRHSRHVAPARRGVAVILRTYWHRQEPALMREVSPHIKRALKAYPRLTEAVTPQANQFSSAAIPDGTGALRMAVTSEEAAEYSDLIRKLIEGAAKSLQAQAEDIEDFADQWIRDNSLSKLTGGLNTTTTQSLRDTIAEAWQNGGSYEQIVQSIRNKFSEFSEQRAGVIAETEVAAAYNAGRDSMARSMGFNQKSWTVESDNPCEECVANEDAGWIDMDDDFPSGPGAPPIHPRCQCVLGFKKSS